MVQQGEDLLRRFGLTVAAKAALHPQPGEPFATLTQEEASMEEPPKKQPSAAKKARKAASAPPDAAPEKKVFVLVPESVSKNAQIVYNILQTRPLSFDDVVRQSALPVPQALSALTELELCGAVSRDERAVYTCL